MVLNLNNSLLINENKQKLSYYSSKNLLEAIEKAFLTKVIPSSIDLSYLIMRLGLVSFFATYFLDSKWKISFNEEDCGLKTINGFSYYGFHIVPKDGYPCYAILYLNTKGTSKFLDVYIPKYGNIFNMKKRSLICASDSASKEEMLAKYIRYYPYFDAKDEDIIETPRISVSCIEKDILSHFEFILSEKEKELKKNILRLNDESDMESLYIDALEIMYVIIKESHYPLMPILYNKLDILGVFGDEETKLYKDFIQIYTEYEKIDLSSPLTTRMFLLNRIKYILETY